MDNHIINESWNKSPINVFNVKRLGIDWCLRQRSWFLTLQTQLISFNMLRSILWPILRSDWSRRAGVDQWECREQTTTDNSKMAHFKINKLRWLFASEGLWIDISDWNQPRNYVKPPKILNFLTFEHNPPAQNNLRTCCHGNYFRNNK